MHLMQHISLLGSVSNNCRHALSWSSYEDKCAILLRNGIYVLTLHPVPSNLSPSLNTAPKFLPHQTDEDPIFDLHWLPKGRLLTRTLSGITSVTEISTGHKQTIQCQSSVSCSYQDWLFLGDHQKTIHAFQDKGGSKNNLGFIEGVHELKLSANASEIIPVAIGASEILLFISQYCQYCEIFCIKSCCHTSLTKKNPKRSTKYLLQKMCLTLRRKRTIL